MPWSEVQLQIRNALTQLLFSKQTYHLLFLWSLTWFSYWLFMKGQYTPINTAGTAVSAALLVSSQFSGVRALFGRARSRGKNRIAEVESSSITASPPVPEATITIEASQEHNLREEILTETQLQIQTLNVDDLKQNDLEVSNETSCIIQDETTEVKPEDNTITLVQVENSNKETLETQRTEDAYNEAPKKTRKLKKHTTEIPIKLAENTQPPPNTDAGQQEFESLMQIAEANAKAEYSLTEERQNNCTPKNAPQEQAPSATNGCPKNLAYYNQTPKPKEIPAECLTCSKLIACVCRTSN